MSMLHLQHMYGSWVSKGLNRPSNKMKNAGSTVRRSGVSVSSALNRLYSIKLTEPAKMTGVCSFMANGVVDDVSLR